FLLGPELTEAVALRVLEIFLLVLLRHIAVDPVEAQRHRSLEQSHDSPHHVFRKEAWPLPAAAPALRAQWKGPHLVRDGESFRLLISSSPRKTPRSSTVASTATPQALWIDDGKRPSHLALWRWGPT